MTSEPETPDNVAEIGSIKISVYMGPNGLGTGFKVDGVTPEAAIGHLIVVTDRLREDRALSWAGDDFEIDLECPNCGTHFGSEDDEGDEYV